MVKKINEENISVSDAVSILSENNCNILQLHSFKDKNRTKPVFAAFFVLGENDEPREAIDEMMKLRSKWISRSKASKIEIESEIDISYLIQQFDTDGSYNITRKCKDLDELCVVAKQCGIKELSDNQRVIKRIDIPLGLSIGEVNENNSRIV